MSDVSANDLERLRSISVEAEKLLRRTASDGKALIYLAMYEVSDPRTKAAMSTVAYGVVLAMCQFAAHHFLGEHLMNMELAKRRVFERDRMASRRNVTVERDSGEWAGYRILGKSGKLVAQLSSLEWKDLGLKPLRKGQSCRLDLQASGIPKKRKAKR